MAATATALRSQAASTRVASALRDPPDTKIRKLWISTPHCGRRELGIARCRNVDELLAVRRERDLASAALRREIRRLDTVRASLRGYTAKSEARRVALTNRMIRLRAALLDLVFAAPVSANRGAGGRPPDHASATFLIATALAEVIEASDTRPSAVLRMLYAHLDDTPEREAFIRAEIRRFNAWRARQLDPRPHRLVRSTRHIRMFLDEE